MPSYLDETGLAYFWGKIKTYVNNAIQSIGALTGVKGDAESTYRTGNVNLTPANIGSPAISDLDDYLPLSAGSTKNLTDDLYLDEHIFIDNQQVEIFSDNGDPVISNDTSGATPIQWKQTIDNGGDPSLKYRKYENGAWSQWLSAFYHMQKTRNANTVLAAPDGSNDIASFRKLVPNDIDGLGDTVGHDQSSSVSVPTSTWKTITSVDLTPGTWVLIGGVLFGSSSNGRRYVAISNNDGSISAGYQRATQNTCPAVSGASVYVHTSYIVTITAAHTYYLLGWQNNGGALNCSGFFRAVRIA